MYSYLKHCTAGLGFSRLWYLTSLQVWKFTCLNPLWVHQTVPCWETCSQGQKGKTHNFHILCERENWIHLNLFGKATPTKPSNRMSNRFLGFSLDYLLFRHLKVLHKTLLTRFKLRYVWNYWCSERAFVHVNTHMYQLQPFSLQIAIQNI